MTDSDLLAVWSALCRCGREKIVFPDVEFSPDDFVRWVRQQDIHLWIVFFRGIPVSMVYLTGMQGKTAYVHFCQFPVGTLRTAERIPVQYAVAMYGAACLLWKKTRSGYALDTLIGTMPVHLRAAHKVALRSGAKLLGVVPKSVYDVRKKINVDALYSVHERNSVPSQWANM